MTIMSLVSLHLMSAYKTLLPLLRGNFDLINLCISCTPLKILEHCFQQFAKNTKVYFWGISHPCFPPYHIFLIGIAVFQIKSSELYDIYLISAALIVSRPFVTFFRCCSRSCIILMPLVECTTFKIYKNKKKFVWTGEKYFPYYNEYTHLIWI